MSKYVALQYVLRMSFTSAARRWSFSPFLHRQQALEHRQQARERRVDDGLKHLALDLVLVLVLATQEHDDLDRARDPRDVVRGEVPLQRSEGAGQRSG